MSDDRAWEQFANCLGMDPELFFPERGDMTAIQQAKQVCAGCVARQACLEANLHEVDGVWGGTTRIERQRLRGERLRRRLR